MLCRAYGRAEILANIVSVGNGGDIFYEAFGFGDSFSWFVIFDWRGKVFVCLGRKI